MDCVPDIIKTLVPPEKSVLLREIGDQSELGGPFRFALDKCLGNLYTETFDVCLQNTKVLLDIIWEKLNTGHWKDVSLSWRYSYSVVSFVKAIAEVCKFVKRKEKESGLENEIERESESDSCVTPEQIFKTCDMGLLMGAPILDDVLSKVSSAFHEYLTTQCHSELTRESEKSEVDIGFSNEICDAAAYTQQEKEDQSKSPNIKSRKRKTEFDGECLSHEFSVFIKQQCQIPVRSCPSLDLFREQFMNEKQSVIIDGGIDYWPAFNDRKWSVGYIKRLAGHRTVPIEIGSKYTEESWSQKLMTIGEFVETFIEQKSGEEKIGYLAQHQLFDQIPELRNDISIPTYCSLTDDDSELDVDINAWFGPKGTISPLHFDPKHNLLAQVVGEKYIRLYSEEETPKLYPHSGHLLSNTSQVDVERPDLVKFPNFSEANFTECVLRQGQMLYIPPKCWHYVRSLDVSFSVSFWWM